MIRNLLALSVFLVPYGVYVTQSQIAPLLLFAAGIAFAWLRPMGSFREIGRAAFAGAFLVGAGYLATHGLIDVHNGAIGASAVAGGLLTRIGIATRIQLMLQPPLLNFLEGRPLFAPLVERRSETEDAKSPGGRAERPAATILGFAAASAFLGLVFGLRHSATIALELAALVFAIAATSQIEPLDSALRAAGPNSRWLVPAACAACLLVVMARWASRLGA